MNHNVGNENAAAGNRVGLTTGDNVVVLENNLMRAEISKMTGFITKLANKKKNIQIPLSLEVAYYQAFQDSGPKSGAYAFVPDSNKTHAVTGKSEATSNMLSDVIMMELQTTSLAVDDGLVSVPRVAFKIGSWVTLEYRVNDDDEFLEIEWTVGPVPIDDKKGKEVVVRFDTSNSIASDRTLYTDSNGLEFMKRVRNHRDTWNLTLHDDREAVSANYFPITTGTYIKDDKRQLNVVTDRAQGVASLVDGQVEVMVHRRLLADDSKGAGEHLNETESVYDEAAKAYVTKGLVVRGNLFIHVDSAADGMRSMRSKMESQFFRPLTVYRKPVSLDVEAKVPWLTVGEFPPNVGLTTLQEQSKQCVMVRLSHLYAVDEHSSLSKPVTVDFTALFSVKNSVVSEVTELVLTGTKELSQESKVLDTLEWKTTDETYDWSPHSLPVTGTSVTLQATEVRAFRVCFANGASMDENDAVKIWSPEDESFGSTLQELADIVALE
uniref:Glycosyl hydrolase family 38 C-terminal domain-containing protein n=1 Tax=Hyaloperonospora arabidopsidis (strain Emoy2) TaxID=559515 RepID=M4BTE0_HYAAE